MEENIKEKPEAEKTPKPSIRPGGAGLTITPISTPSSQQPTTPIPKVFAPPPPLSPVPELFHKKKRDGITFLLLLAVIFNIFSLYMLVSIWLDKVPAFFK